MRSTWGAGYENILGQIGKVARKNIGLIKGVGYGACDVIQKTYNKNKTT